MNRLIRRTIHLWQSWRAKQKLAREYPWQTDYDFKIQQAKRTHGRTGSVRALEKTIEAMRGIERWGASDMLERAFSAFTALPPYDSGHWADVLNVSRDATADQINSAYRAKAKSAHSDTGGDDEAMSRLNVARDQALKERGV